MVKAKSIVQASRCFLALVLFMGLGICAVSAQAQEIQDGALVKTADNPDVYIVKIVGEKKFKRLILNAAIFKSYGHLRWENIQIVSQKIMDELTVSDLVIEVNVDGSIANPRVYRVSSAPSSDVGERRWLNMSAQEFEQAGFDWDAIYKINQNEASPDFYPEEMPLTLAEVLSEQEQSFTIEADDFGFYLGGDDIGSILVSRGRKVSIVYEVRSVGVYFGGLELQGCGEDSGAIKPGSSATIQFIAENNCTISSYWPASSILKDTMQVIVSMQGNLFTLFI